VIVRVTLTPERPRGTLTELTADAGFDPRIKPDGALEWEFYSKEWGDLFYHAAKHTRGVACVDRIG
jgi:hypothetical protein